MLNTVIGAAVRVAYHGAVGVVLPRTANAYRPYALRHPVLSFLNAFLLASALLTSLTISLTPEVARLSTITTPTIVRLTNDARVRAGLPPLKENPALQRSALLKAQHMLQHDYFAHVSPDGLNPWVWFERANYDYTYAGENLAIDFVEGEDVVTAWLRSPGHRRNLLADRYADTGIAVVTGEFEGRTTTVVIQHFGSLSAAAARAAARPPAKLSVAPRAGPPAPQVAERQTTSTPVLALAPPTIPFPTQAPRVAPVHTILLPDPRGQPGIVLLAVPASSDIARATLTVPGRDPIPLTRRADVLFARVALNDLQRKTREPAPTDAEAGATLLVADARGNSRIVAPRTLLPYVTVNPPQTAPRARVAAAVLRVRPWVVGALALLTALLAVNILVHLRMHRLVHADVLAHTLVVVGLGATLVFLS